MTPHRLIGAASTALLATSVAAQDRAALCSTAYAQITEGLTVSRELMQAPLAGIDTASQLTAQMTGEQQMGAAQVLTIIVEASIEGLEERNSRLADNQAGLAQTLYELCGNDWPDEAPAPQGETHLEPDLSE